MKIYISFIFLMLFILFKSGYSQKTNELINPTDSGYYFLYSTCQEVYQEEKPSSNCFKIVLDCKNWGDSDARLVTTSNILFFYYPKTEKNCTAPKIFLLKPTGLTWRYSDINTKIIIKMIPVETAFSYQLSEINIFTKNGASCIAPPNIKITDPYNRN